MDTEFILDRLCQVQGALDDLTDNVMDDVESLSMVQTAITSLNEAIAEVEDHAETKEVKLKRSEVKFIATLLSHFVESEETMMLFADTDEQKSKVYQKTLTAMIAYNKISKLLS